MDDIKKDISIPTKPIVPSKVDPIVKVEKYYIKYSNTGAFDGFLIDTFNTIPKEGVIELSKDVYDECLNYNCSLKSLVSIPILINNVSDIDIYFNKKSLIEETNYIDPDKTMMKEIMNNKLSMIEKEKTISMLGKELMQNKVANIQKDNQIKMLSQQVMNNKLVNSQKESQLEMMMKEIMNNKMQLIKFENNNK